MIINSQLTIYALEYRAAMDNLVAYTPRPNTTLNEKFGVLPDEPAGTDVTHGIKYMTLGTGGVPTVDGSVNYSYSQHSPLDAALFEHIPFVMREIGNDLNPAERAKYRMRVTINIAGISYYQYFMRVITPTDRSTNTYRISATAGGAGLLSLLSTDTADYLSPVPTVINAAINENNEFVSVLTKLKFELSLSDLSEITDAINILYGPNSVKPITEIGICSGLESSVDGIAEVIQAQIHYHVAVDINTRLSYDARIGYLRAIELGGTEPIHA